MGNGSGVYGLNSRIFTNSYSNLSRMQFESQRPLGNSFAGSSVPQYKSTIYRSLANNGAGSGSDSRVLRYNNSIGASKISFH